MVKILYEPNDACTCMGCKKRKTKLEMKIEYAGGGGDTISLCPSCIKQFEREMFYEIEFSNVLERG